ncbi:hypothetical protein [Salinimicrobium sp. HB62]|uniref:hypothetical protein n=1 Tax=Salinimicrobium sp. HB62 TaxID=3077781 RepID=UPI002D79AEB4|nr:hypothetical protein [Salinimicrobium sp. HB62]
MKYKNICIIIVISLCYVLNTSAQKRFFINENSYPASQSFSLQNPETFSSKPEIDVMFVKKADQYMLVLSKSAPMGQSRLKGDILLYLDDGSVIKCVDRGINDYVNETSTSMYYLSDSGIEKLRNSNLHTLRYSTTGGDYTAVNKGKESLNIYVPFIKKANVPKILGNF